MPNFTAVANIYLKSEDYVAAIGEADDIKIAVERDMLDTDAGEEIDIIEIVEGDEVPEPRGQMMRLRQARNILIRLRTKETYETARFIDEIVHAMAMRADPGLAQTSYDYGNMMRVLKEVVDGANPLDH